LHLHRQYRRVPDADYVAKEQGRSGILVLQTVYDLIAKT
jgi:hypothetical protein